MILLLNSPPKFTETMFLDTVVYKGTRFNEKVFLDVKTMETFLHTFCPLSPTDLSKEFEESVSKFNRTLDGWWWAEATNTIWKKNCNQKKMKLTGTEVRPHETKQQGRKRNVAFRDTIPAIPLTTQRRIWQLDSSPRSNPLPFYIPFFTKKVPLSAGGSPQLFPY